MYLIDNYDVFVFDFDGTILDTESYHYLAWKTSIQSEYPTFDISENDYFRLIHNLDTTTFCHFLQKEHNINNYQELYIKKGLYYKKLLKENEIESIGNVEVFLDRLVHKKKKLIICTNSSITSIQYLVNKYPFLKKFNKIYTKEDFTKRKPDPECYQKISNEYKGLRLIGFEDSLVGTHALCQVPEITSFHIRPPNYYHNSEIEKYNNNVIDTYDVFA